MNILKVLTQTFLILYLIQILKLRNIFQVMLNYSLKQKIFESFSSYKTVVKFVKTDS